MMHEMDRMIDAYDRGRITRRRLIAQLAAACAGAGALNATARSAGQSSGASNTEKSTFAATGIDHIALPVTDVERSRDFYQRHLGLTMRHDGGANGCFLNCGRDFLAIFRAEQPAMHHYCYSIKDYDPDEAMAKLEAAKLNPRRQGHRVYFDDPDGLVVQVAAG